ncbi:MAG: aminotransferase class IV family protein [Campylobacterota bacterium]|nr:aminotransferase class IV family protein [Campylobacterota bacterium]
MNETFLETIRLVDAKIFNLSYHQKRYEEVLHSLGCSEFKDLKEYLHPPHVGTYRCRLVYSVDNITVTYHRYEKRDIKSLKLVYNDTIDYAKKSTCRKEIDKLFEMRGRCDDILIVKNSFITDTSIANIAFYEKGVWSTPSKPLLEGTTRARLLDEGKIIQADIKVQELYRYSKIALLNAMLDFDIITTSKYRLKDMIC